MNITHVTRQIIEIYCDITTAKTKYGMIRKVMTSDGELPERTDELFAKSCCQMSHSEM